MALGVTEPVTGPARTCAQSCPRGGQGRAAPGRKCSGSGWAAPKASEQPREAAGGCGGLGGWPPPSRSFCSQASLGRAQPAPRLRPADVVVLAGGRGARSTPRDARPQPTLTVRCRGNRHLSLRPRPRPWPRCKRQDAAKGADRRERTGLDVSARPRGVACDLRAASLAAAPGHGRAGPGRRGAPQGVASLCPSCIDPRMTHFSGVKF